MSKYIKVEDAMDAACIIFCDAGEYCSDFKCMSVRDVFDRIPAERVKSIVEGVWIPEGTEYKRYYKCSACGWMDIYLFVSKYKFCPNCGAEMAGVYDEEGKKDAEG